MASDGHAAPAGDCMVCFEELDSELYIEFKVKEDGPWKPCLGCQTCIQQMIDTQWDKYVEALAKVNCRAAQRRLLADGPPINVYDKHLFPKEDGELVHELWFMSDGNVHSAKLKGSLEGEERIKFWEDQKAFELPEEPPEEGEDAAA